MDIIVIANKLEKVKRNIDFFIKHVSNENNALALEKLSNLMLGIESLETDKIISLMMFIDYLMTSYQRFRFPYDLLLETYIILQSMI